MQSQAVNILEKRIPKVYYWVTWSFKTPPSTRKTALKLLQEIIDIWQDDIV